MSFIKRRDFLLSSGAALLVAGAGSYWALRLPRHSVESKADKGSPKDSSQPTNSITEGLHNRMEEIIRRAYGFRNFENFRWFSLNDRGSQGIC